MLSGEQIVSMAEDQGRKAKKLHYLPYPVKDLDVDTLQSFPFPNFGSYRPDGWELVTYRTCDATGMGYESEPALTVNGLKKWIRDCQKSDDNFAMAIIETGQFQVVVGLFRPDSRDFTRTGKLTENEMRLVGGRK